MNEHDDQSKAYAFCLDDIRYGHVYYRTISLFSGSFGENGRDQRHAHPVTIANFEHIMKLLNVRFQWVRNSDDMATWLTSFGWALIMNDYATRHLCAFLGSRECVKSAIGLFWDVVLPRHRATSRRIPPDVRQRVLQRDNHRCIECGKMEGNGVTLTMDHVIPYSRGGETSEGNLVTLCKDCNQKHGNSAHPHLFVLAGLDHDWDPKLLHNVISPDPDAVAFATTLSQNIMVSRCNIECLPLPTQCTVGQ